jgi:hypothetical protein
LIIIMNIQYFGKAIDDHTCRMRYSRWMFLPISGPGSELIDSVENHTVVT